MAKTSRALRKWRARQKKGAIMGTATFEKIMARAKSHGMSAARAKKIAGAAYWRTARAKFKKARRRK